MTPTPTITGLSMKWIDVMKSITLITYSVFALLKFDCRISISCELYTVIAAQSASETQRLRWSTDLLNPCAKDKA